ncbi:Pimeloyl-ACP methyl ester carboxylesterase [Plantibacter flavus]|uniref:Pimeloyl-ACP methyl ester carboxylesterase n=1 Tax=Plantibacter flavus TaxID=150123 RepID=A0A3N2C7W2_9MICO|nr:epoxide hydrolase [Plantibacter flavus]ROR83394.1 pimeloyl-ACP methyl ester carboxylesterase [Plantibacter flavus]SMG23119.1 Pimeloyl-ACP methyl ester carboxylesterase [Plantibacter flavus]
MRSFRIQVPDADLEDLRRRLDTVRLPAAIGDAGEESALALDRLRALVDHWRDGFDWRRIERELQEVPQFEAEVDGQRLHVARLPAPDGVTVTVPVIAFHGWPYSFIEMLPLARELAGRTVDLGDGRTLGFEVVVPSLPGYGFSAPLAGRPFTGPVVAELMHALMTETLGHASYLTYGEDVGSTTSDWLAALYPESVIGQFATHAAFPSASRARDRTAEEQDWIDRHDQEWARGLAYARVQATRPEILATALNDSPVGLAAWIAEKLLAWAGAGDWWTDDELLTTVSLYWFTQSIGSSFRPYRDHPKQPELPLIEVPVAVAVQTGERGLPRSYAARAYSDIRSWTELDRGAHFTAWQVPVAVADRIQAFVETLPITD